MLLKNNFSVATPWETRGKNPQNPLGLNSSPQKKVLSLVLCVAVMLSVMVLGAGAAFSDQADIENTEAVDACSALNIIGGYEDGSFHPERNIKRSEITKMICVALNAGNEPNVSTNVVPTFSDVRGTSAEWAEGYIEACVAQGIVSGVGGGRFNPDGNVTGAQLAKMLLVALGYNADTEKFTGNAWETNVNVRAAQKSLYKGLESMDTSAAVTRDQAAQMVWNAMQAYVVEYKTNIVTDANGNLSTQVVVQDKVVGGTNDKITLLRDKYDALVNIGTLVSIDKTDLRINMSAADAVASDSGLTNFSKLTTDYSGLMGQKVKVIFDANSADKVLGVFATDDNTVYNVIANQTSKSDDKVSFGGNSYSIDVTDGGIRTYVDGQFTGSTTLTELDSNYLNPNAYTFVDSDGNGRLDTLIVKTYNVAQVTYVDSAKIIAANKTYKFADENIADGLAKNDWVVITENLYNDNKDISKVDVQTATLDALRDNRNEAVYFDGAATMPKADYSEYQIGDTWYNGGEWTTGNAAVQSDRSENDLNAVKAGDSVDYVAVNGIMFYVKKSSGTETGRVANVALVVNTDDSTATVSEKAKLAFFNGKTAIVDVDKVYDASGKEVAFNTLTEGVVYEYTVSGNAYSFYPLKDGVTNDKYEEYYGDLTYRGDKTVDAGAITAMQGTNGKFDGMTIDDNAEVLLYNGTTTAQIIGKQLKSFANLTNIDGSRNGLLEDATAYAFSGDMNGLDRIGALALRVKNATDLSVINAQTWNHYGFILSDAKWVVLNKTIEYQIWNGSQTLTVQEDHNTLNDRQARTVIGYDTLDEIAAASSNATHVISDVRLLDKSIQNFTFSAITAVSNDNKTVKFANGDELDVSDATILYVDSDGKTGIQDGAIKKAIKDKNGDLLANALYIKSGTDAELLVVDQLTYLKSSAYETLVDSLYDNTNKVIYGANAVMDEAGTDDNQGSSTDGNFTYTTTDKSKLTVGTADIQGNGNVIFTVVPGSGVEASKTTFQWTVSVNGIPVENSTNEQGAVDSVSADKMNYVTTKVSAKDGDKITIALSNIVVTGASEDATAADINGMLTQENADVTLSSVPSGEIAVPKNASLTLPEGTNIAGETVIEGEGIVKITGNITVSGDADLSNVQPNIAADKTVTVSDGATLKIDAHTDGNLPSGTGTLEVAPGGTLKSVGTSEENEGQEVTFVGTDSNARIMTAAGTSVKITLSDSGSHKMTITGNASIPVGQIWYTMFGSGKDKTKGIDTTLENGTLTVNGTLKLASGTTGTTFTVDNGAKVVVGKGATVTVAAKAILTVSGQNAFVGTDNTSTLSVTKKADSQTISGVTGVDHDSTKDYTWNSTTWN